MLGLGQKGTFPLREKCPYLELFLSAFTCIRTEYGEILRISPYSVRMREKADQNNSECGHFLRGVQPWLKVLVSITFYYEVNKGFDSY